MAADGINSPTWGCPTRPRGPSAHPYRSPLAFVDAPDRDLDAAAGNAASHPVIPTQPDTHTYLETQPYLRPYLSPISRRTSILYLHRNLQNRYIATCLPSCLIKSNKIFHMATYILYIYHTDTHAQYVQA